MAAVSSYKKTVLVPAALNITRQFENASLYVGDLDVNVNEAQLYDLFGQIGQVVSIRVCRDHVTQSSLGYAYVNFYNSHDAVIAMEHLNFTPLNGKPIRIMFSHRDPSIRKSGFANVFIKNLDTSIDNKALHDTFASFGTVLSCKIALDCNGQSRGFGFVQFDNDVSAQNAIEKLDGMLINEKKVYVGLFIRHQERSGNGSANFTNVYVKNFSGTYTDEDLKKLFDTFGVITSAVVMKDDSGNSKCFGFVNFQSSDAAAAAVERLNGTSTNEDKILFVGRAQRKTERVAELKAKFEQEKIKRYEKLKGANLYIKNLEDNINDEKLKELFSEFGTIKSCKVMLDVLGNSKGYGFVAFSTPEQASKAMSEMHGKVIGQKPLFVAVAERKEERKARLQALFSQFQTPGGIASLHTGIVEYHPGFMSPQQFYFGQDTTGFMSPQPTGGYGFQQPFMSSVGSDIAPNFIMPYHHQRQGHPRHRVTGRRVGNFEPMQQNQTPNRNIGRSERNRQVVPAPPPNELHGELSNKSLASTLASSPPEIQHTMLREHLYPLVSRLASNNQAAKVTEMLLEMDQAEVIHLIESPEELKIKVSEAMQVLRDASPSSEAGDNVISE
ncbi:polyadenylate-binding protein [Trifolium repens]|nr:polyadenylate-binding protein [Trifolium repens]